MADVKKVRRWRLDWPLLGKELLEQSARKQMYIVRVIYAVMLFGAFCIYYFRNMSEGPVLTLGRGLEPFQFLIMAQFTAIILFLPPQMAGAIAHEKERETLGLLFLTDLTPWELILQKYFGRLIPMLTLLFLSLPLLAVTYSLGGVSVFLLFYSVASLFLTCLGVGALALECSANEATMFSALLRCWGFCIVFAFCCFTTPLGILFGTPMRSSIRYSFFVPMFYTTAGYVVATWLFLARARQILGPRAFVTRKNPFSHQFRKLDLYWKDVRKIMRAITRRRDREARTLATQVMQRELQSNRTPAWSLEGYFLTRMQVPNLLAVSIVIGFVVMIYLAFTVWMSARTAPIFVVVGGIWILAMLTLPIQSANAIASERMNERLGPLLTTPLTSREILDEWLAPIRRWIQFLIRPLVVVLLVEAVVKYATHDPKGRLIDLSLYLGISLLTLVIYPRLVQWSCLWMGLRIRNQLRALMTAQFVIMAWCIVPLPLASYLENTGMSSFESNAILKYISPISVIRAAELAGQAAQDEKFLLIVLPLCHFAVAAGLMFMFRRICLTKADDYLGRI